MICTAEILKEERKASPAIDRKVERGGCATPHCRGRHRAKRRHCNTCRARKYEDPTRRLFRNLKASAKRRGKAFSLTLETFAPLAVAGGYTEGHGRTAGGITVDRINPDQGYAPGNIQFLSNAENVAKRFTDYADQSV